jgi:hypothetical protein
MARCEIGGHSSHMAFQFNSHAMSNQFYPPQCTREIHWFPLPIARLQVPALRKM